MLSRITRSWSLIKASGAVLRQDKELLVLPLCSGIASLVLIASFAVPLIASGALDRIDADSAAPDGRLWALAFAFYLSQYFVMFFFNAALVGAAMIRLDGGDPTVADGLRIARSRLAAILGYAAIAATIGLILRMIEERAGFIGRWIAGLLGVAFTVATFLTVPILVSRNIAPIDAVKQSASLLKRTWGENIIGNIGMGLVFTIFYLIVGTIGMLGVYAAAQSGNNLLTLIALGITVVVVVGIGLVQSALQGVYAAALFRFAAEGEVAEGFSDALLHGTFLKKT